jgi:hypothetical protein
VFEKPEAKPMPSYARIGTQAAAVVIDENDPATGHLIGGLG